MSIELSGSDQIGICYGMAGDNLPPPSEAIAICKAHNIRKMRLFTPDEDVLCALKGSNIEVMLGVLNSDIEKLADPSFARSWVQKNVLEYWPDVKFRYIAVGTEVMPHETNTSRVAPYVLPAMKNIHDSILAQGIENQVKVSITTDLRIVGRSYPPSAAAFPPEVTSFIIPIIKFLKDTGAPLLLSVYAYWSYVNTPVNDMSISYALFTASSSPVKDRQYKYQNLLDAMVDAMNWALDKADASTLEVVLCGIGWPSEGGERGASYDNALTFYSNLVKHVERGTPRRPRKPLETYLFSLFDENKTGYWESEKHFGLFFPNKLPKYPIT